MQPHVLYTLLRSCDSPVNVKGIVKKVYITRYELSAKALTDKIYAKNAFIKSQNSVGCLRTAVIGTALVIRTTSIAKKNNNRKLGSSNRIDKIKT